MDGILRGAHFIYITLLFTALPILHICDYRHVSQSAERRTLKA